VEVWWVLSTFTPKCWIFMSLVTRDLYECEFVILQIFWKNLRILICHLANSASEWAHNASIIVKLIYLRFVKTMEKIIKYFLDIFKINMNFFKLNYNNEKSWSWNRSVQLYKLVVCFHVSLIGKTITVLSMCVFNFLVRVFR
jgi:hypothetical protein